MSHRKAQKDRFYFKAKSHYQLVLKHISAVYHQIIKEMKTNCFEKTFRAAKPFES